MSNLVKEIQQDRRRLNEHFRMREAWDEISALPPAAVTTWRVPLSIAAGHAGKMEGDALGNWPRTLPALFLTALHTQGLRYS